MQRRTKGIGVVSVSATKLIASTLTLAFLAACGEPDIILPGERLDFRDGMAGAEAPAANSAPRISLPKAKVNSSWTHLNGSATHNLGHVALAAAPTLAFAVDIGEGESRRARIAAAPVISNGVVYTLDARSALTATSASGQVLWTASVGPKNAADLSATSGGMIAVSGPRVYAATGFGELIALDSATGAEVWVQDLGAPASTAPTIAGNLVYVVGRDSRAWALDAGTGRVRWTLNGTPPEANFASGSSVAVAGGLAIFPMPSGEVIGAFETGGLQRWSSVVVGERLGQSVSAYVSDIAGSPVVSGNTVYVGNISGRVVAMSLATGERIWTAREGAASAVWPAGGSLFLVNDINQLVRMNASTGDVIWRQPLPDLVERRFGRPNARHANYGPILAGGNVITASSDGFLRQFDPVSGAMTGQIEIPGGAASEPVVAGGVLYVVTKEGQLLAFR